MTVGNELLVILVVEDEFFLQERCNNTLWLMVALTLKAGIPAVISDIHLKGPLTGWDVAKRARELNPDIRVFT